MLWVISWPQQRNNEDGDHLLVSLQCTVSVITQQTVLIIFHIFSNCCLLFLRLLGSSSWSETVVCGIFQSQVRTTSYSSYQSLLFPDYKNCKWDLNNGKRFGKSLNYIFITVFYNLNIGCHINREHNLSFPRNDLFSKTSLKQS